MAFKLGNAPCSWGTIENTSGERVGYAQMLDELSQAGFEGTELGDLGYMPSDPEKLREALDKRGLELIASWVTVRLYDEAHHTAGVERAVKVAKLLAEVGGQHCTINVGDDHSTVQERFYNTGRIKPEHGLSEAGWQVYIEGINKVADAVRSETGLRTALHPHGSTYVETPAEIDEFLNRTDSEKVGIVFDTGHYMLGGGDPVAGVRKYGERIWLMHFKDFNPEVIPVAIEKNLNYQEMIGEGMFSELGTGAVDFLAVLEAMNEVGYSGWIVVEQDVLPGMGSPAENAKRNRAYLRTIGL